MKRSPIEYSSPVSRLSKGRPTKSAQVVSWMLDCGRGHSGIKFNNRNPQDRLARESQGAPDAERKWVRAAPTLKDGRPDPSLLTSIHYPPCTPRYGLSQCFSGQEKRPRSPHDFACRCFTRHNALM